MCKGGKCENEFFLGNFANARQRGGTVEAGAEGSDVMHTYGSRTRVVVRCAEGESKERA